MKNELDLSNTKELIRGVKSIPTDQDDDFSVEAILAEFGSRPGKKAPAAEPEALSAVPAEEPAPEKPEAAAAEEAPAEEELPSPASAEEPSLPAEEPLPEEAESAHLISLEELVAQTVDQVKQEEAQNHQATAKKQHFTLPFLRRDRGLQEDMIYDDEATGEVVATPGLEEPEEELWTPEPREAEELFAGLYRLQSKSLLLALPVSAVLLLLHLPGWLGLSIPGFSDNAPLQTVIFLCLQVILLICGNGVFVRAYTYLQKGRCSAELLVALSNLLTLADGIFFLLRPEKHNPAAPLILVSSAAMLCAIWAETLKTRAQLDSCHVAGLGQSPYMITATPQGACKQPAGQEGFYHYLTEPDSSVLWQSVLLPLILTASLVFAILCSFSRQQDGNFLWCWSAILSAATGLSLPLVYSSSFGLLTRRLKKAGHALAGYAGAHNLCRSGKIIITDSDLFPAGTVRIGGIRLFGEEQEQAALYAAAIAESGRLHLARLFRRMLEDNRRLPRVDDFHFYEEGGMGGIIHGESVLLGTESFLRKMRVSLPTAPAEKTDLFLAVDKHLIAIFNVKYLVSDNVDWAIHALRLNRVTPVLAVRDPHITPALLKQKFGTTARAIYPALSLRLALSEESHAQAGLANALLYREGLMPYAELLVGAKRMRSSVRRANILSLLGSVFSCLLAFYFSFVGSYTILSPVPLLIYLLLWLLPTLILAGNVNRY